ncbi:protocadherin 1 [Echinococcus multilocularis]|uniref:Protocadherin 1 n=1 Tax=Echinococcus multilocularis TaxID=6211 RepID=A0A068Y543_ECHMU|nr:protocadherin 1 [Echinococcus multilocularis]
MPSTLRMSLDVVIFAFLLVVGVSRTEVIELQMSEELPGGSVIVDLRALISKSGKFPELQMPIFKAVGSDDIGNRLVDVTSEGKLVVIHRIDREKLCPLYPLSILPGPQSDFAAPPPSTFGFSSQPILTTSLASNGQCVITLRVAVTEKGEVSDPLDVSNIYHLRITVLDVNDQAPFWPENLQRHVVEFRDGDPVGKRQSLPLAIDLDQGENARISYRIEQDLVDEPSPEGWDSLPFKLIHDQSDGSLYLQTEREIDHEATSSYKLVLKATDGVDKSLPDSIVAECFLRQHTSTLTLTVVVQDINDNDPKFTQPVFTPDRPVSEATPVGSVVLRLKATDADSGENGAFHFGFAPNVGWRSIDKLAQHLFDVRPNGNVVVRRPLDVDRQWKLVDDLKKSSNSDLFGRDNVKGMEFSFKVVVVDEADSKYARSSEATVNIVVVDENDEAPVIGVMRPTTSGECVRSLGKPTGITSSRLSTQTSYACVFENAPVDTFVATIQVSDMDFCGEDERECVLDNKNFTLVAEEHANTRLSANQLTHVFNSQALKGPSVSQYAILTAVALDREATPFQQIQILCTDRANHQSVHNVTVLIGDINDHKPQFAQEVMTYQVPENSPPGTILKPLYVGPTRNSVALATDGDVGKNGMVKYSFIEGSRTAENFSIDSFTGVISTRIRFDREENGKYVFNILAVDQADGENTLTGTGTVEVVVLDVNDNPPVFAQETYTFQIAENLPRGTRVGQVTAFDLDDQGPISYYLSNDYDALVFQIDRTSGELFTRRPLDREDQSNYTFKVLVRDFAALGGGVEKKTYTATATVTVVLEDENDNSPVFILPNATANALTVAVSQTLGHKLAVIIASDADEGDNGRITYKIKAGNSLNLFSIDPQSGLLFLADSLSRFNEATNTSSADEAATARAIQLSTQPTVHVITLEACDSGVEPRCTVSPNLRIHVQLGRRYRPGGESGGGVGAAAGGGEQNHFSDGSQSHSVTLQPQEGDGVAGDGGQAGWNGMKISSTRVTAGGLRGWSSGSNEIIIICMSVLFVILLVAILALTLLLRNCKIGPVKQMTVSATQRSLSRSKTPTYLGTIPSSRSGVEVAESVVGTLNSPPPSQPLPPLAVSGGGGGSGVGVIQSQSEMILCQRAGGHILPQSQSFFEMPKSMTQEFATFAPASLEGYQGGCKKRACAARSADLLLPVKYARIPNNKEITPQGQAVDKIFVSHPYAVPRNDAVCCGEYQALQATGLYALEKHLEGQQHQVLGQNGQPPQLKGFGPSISCVPRFLASGGRTGTQSDDSFPMQRVVDGHSQVAYTYGRYVGLKPNQTFATNNIDPCLFDQQQQQQPNQQTAQRLYVRDFPRSKSAHTVAAPVVRGSKSAEGSGESSEVGVSKSAEECGEESMMLLLPEAEGRSEMSEPLSTTEERVECFPPLEGQQQMSSASSSKLIASAFREASFV